MPPFNILILALADACVHVQSRHSVSFKLKFLVRTKPTIQTQVFYYA